MAEESLIQAVTLRRAREARDEIRRHYPEAEVTYEVCGGRGIITACDGRFIISKEFVESADTLSDPHCMIEYARVLQGRSRLVVVVPLDRAVGMRLRLLELNNWWLFYYQIHYYDEGGEVRRLDRRTWRRMRDLPPDEEERAIEVA